MKIVDKRVFDEIDFDSVKCGNVFSISGEFWLKIEYAQRIDGCTLNAVRLRDGKISFIPADTKVDNIHGELVITESF